MYRHPETLLVDNPINRYLISSPMLPNLITSPEGGMTLYVQNRRPAPDKIANWLPAPTGTFIVQLRLYLPKPAALNGTWQTPTLIKTS